MNKNKLEEFVNALDALSDDISPKSIKIQIFFYFFIDFKICFKDFKMCFF
jgi:hypothetical protein